MACLILKNRETFVNSESNNHDSIEEIPDGFYIDDTGEKKRVPLGYVATPDKRGYQVVSETTQAGSKIPVSTQPEENDLLHRDTNNFNMSFHSVDAAQYFNIDAIDKHGNIEFDNLHDLFPKETINKRPYMPTYADSVLFSRSTEDTQTQVEPAPNDFTRVYSRGGVSH